MNEQFKQLALKSGIAYMSEQTAYFKANDGLTVLPSVDGLEKFAELIIRECANHCDLLLDHKISSEWSRGTHDCSRAIKKHFGVEE